MRCRYDRIQSMGVRPQCGVEPARIGGSAGGKLEIVFSDDGSTVQMVQGGGTLDGVCEYHYEDEGVRLTFDNNGTDLVYACVFADFDGLTMVALSDTSGYNAVYFVQ